MATEPIDLLKDSLLVDDGKDSLVIVKDNGDIPGGKTLNVADFTADVIPAGTPILKTTGGDYVPLGVTSGAYDSIPSGAVAVGVLKASILKSNPQAAILVNGVVNEAVCPAPYTTTLKNKLTAIAFI